MGTVHLGNAALREGDSLRCWWEADRLSLMVLEGHLLGSSAGTGTVQPTPMPGSPNHWPCEIRAVGRAEGNGYIIDGTRTWGQNQELSLHRHFLILVSTCARTVKSYVI